MTREELIAYDRWLTENKWGSSEIITPEQAADLYLAKHPLPPAEGAEQRIRVRNILQDFYRRGEYELEQAEEDIMRLFQQQPTAEGAEEILVRNLGSLMPLKYGVIYNKTIDAMTEFATLHAQRIADKMVGERLREELIKYDQYYWGQRGNSESEVDEYLKTREK